MNSGCRSDGLRTDENFAAHQAPLDVRLNSKYSPVPVFARKSSATSYFHNSGVNCPGDASGWMTAEGEKMLINQRDSGSFARVNVDGEARLWPNQSVVKPIIGRSSFPQTKGFSEVKICMAKIQHNTRSKASAFEKDSAMLVFFKIIRFFCGFD